MNICDLWTMDQDYQDPIAFPGVINHDDFGPPISGMCQVEHGGSGNGQPIGLEPSAEGEHAAVSWVLGKYEH